MKTAGLKSGFGSAIAMILIVCMTFTACNTSWVQQATAIVAALTPAALNILQLVVLLQGKTVNPDQVQLVTKWSDQAQSDIKLIGALLDQYNSAAADAKPDLLSKINTAVTVAQSNLNSLLPALHIADPATTAKVQAVVSLVAAELSSLQTLVELAQGKTVTRGAPTMAAAFKKAYNETMTAPTGSALVDAATAGLTIK